MSVVKLSWPRPDVAIVTLDRPEARNAAGNETWPALDTNLTRARHEGARAVIVAGSQGTFCAGGDLREQPAVGRGAHAASARLASAQTALTTLEEMDAPVIAAVEGVAVGIGWGLALACDLVVAADDATFSAPFLSRGVVPDGLVWWRLVRAIGLQRAGALIYGGKPIGAQEAHELGLVGEVVPSGTAVHRAQSVAEVIASYPPGTVELTKRMLRHADSSAAVAVCEMELTSAALNHASGAPDEGRTAFLERRPPDFSSLGVEA